MIMIQDIDNFCTLLEQDTIRQLKADKLDCSANLANAQTKSTLGRTYAKILSGGSVRYFIRLTDGVIFASKGWNAPNLKRSFGTVYTMNDFYWGHYEGTALKGTPWTMVPTKFGYQTAVAV